MTQRGVGLFLLICALLAGAFFGLLEQHTETVDGPLRGEAARNPYLALGRLLEGMGLPVTVKRDLGELDALPPSDATLFMLGRRAYLTAKRTRELRDWVKRGGHLVVQAWQPQSQEGRRPDVLLDALGVSLLAPYEDEEELHEESDDASDATKPSEPEAKDEEKKKDTEPSRWSPEPDVIMRIEFDERYALEIDVERAGEPVETWPGKKLDHGYTIALGLGHVTVWSDDRFLRNDGIGRWDHAELAYRLVRMFERSGTTWIVVRDAARLSLWTRILESAWTVCIALAAWLAFYFWSIAPRFGPIRPDPPAERRELMEHVRASGSFLLRNGGFDTLVSAVRSALVRRIQQRHPQWLLLSGTARAARVAEHTGLAAEEIEDALESASSTQRETLVKRIATLEAIRKRL